MVSCPQQLAPCRFGHVLILKGTVPAGAATAMAASSQPQRGEHHKACAGVPVGGFPSCACLFVQLLDIHWVVHRPMLRTGWLLVMGVVTRVGILGEDLSMYRGLLACCVAPFFVSLLAASALATPMAMQPSAAALLPGATINYRPSRSLDCTRPAQLTPRESADDFACARRCVFCSSVGAPLILVWGG